MTVSDTRGNASRTYVNQIRFSAPPGTVVTLTAAGTGGSPITFGQGAESIPVSFKQEIRIYQLSSRLCLYFWVSVSVIIV